MSETNAPVPNTTMFTCNTCGLAFPTAELQRLHMKTDWHRYNLKRRVAGLPPITAEVFAEKILQQQQQEQEAQRTNNGKRGGVRQVTKKDKKKEEQMMRKQALLKQAFASTRDTDTESINLERPSSPTGSVASSSFSLGEPINQFTDDEHSDANSIADTASINGDSASGTEEEQQQRGENDEDREFDSEDEDEIDRYIKHKMSKRIAIPANTCLISGKVFENVEEKTAYMTKTYGLYVPEREFLIDLEGLMTYLGEKVGLGFMCLKCSFQGRSLESVRAHMISKSHIMIPYEEEDEKLEIGDFFDFTSSYKSVTRKSRLRKQVVADDEGWVDEDDEDFEEVEGGESGSEDEDLDEYNTAYVDGLGYELALPSGARIGHRSLAKYYRQNLRPDAPLREGAGTVLAVNNRVLMNVRDKNTDLALKDSWKQEKKRTNEQYRKEGKYINQKSYFRQELLQ